MEEESKEKTQDLFNEQEIKGKENLMETHSSPFNFKLIIETLSSPKKAMDKSNFNAFSGLIYLLSIFLILFLIKLMLISIPAIITGKDLIQNSIIIIIHSMRETGLFISFFITASFAGAISAKTFFNGTGNFSRTFGAMALAVSPIFFFGLFFRLFNLLTLFLSTGVEETLYLIFLFFIFLISVFTYYVMVDAVWVGNNITFLGAIISTLIAMIPALIVLVLFPHYGFLIEANVLGIIN